MSRKKKLVIDGQIFQTEARDRGMGRYSAFLVEALAAHSGSYESIEIILTGNLPITDEEKVKLADVFSVASIRTADLFSTAEHTIEEAAANNKTVLNSYVNEQLNKGFEVDYLVLSLFQEPVVAVFPADVRKFLLFYDLIPYLYHKRYRPVMPFDNYLKRFKYIFEADKIFTISQTVADDLSVYLGIPADRLVKIDGAAVRSTDTPAQPSVKLPEKYILMPTSDDPRKNNLRAVLGFEEFRVTERDSNYKLVVTSKIKKRERDHLKLFSNNLIFTGNLPEEQLDWLYEHCQAVLFVPEYEGLGLPVLEAVETGKSVVCSSIGAFKEISEDAFCYCDHEDPTSIADALKTALTSPSSKTLYKNIKTYYTWPKTAERFIAGIRGYKSRIETDKPKIAIFTPTPEGFSAIGKVVAESHAAMSEYFDIDYYAEHGLHQTDTRPNFLQYVAPMHSAQAFGAKTYRDYQAVIYHIGNGDYHLESIKNALYLPGYAIPHDTNIKEAYRVMGETGMMPPERIELEAKLDKMRVSEKSYRLTSVLTRQLGVLTHSHYAAHAVKEVMVKNTPLKTANLPVAVPVQAPFRQYDKITIGLAGIIADIKGVEVIELLAKHPAFSNCHIKIFGFSHVSQETIDRLNSYQNLTVATGLSDFEFQTSLNKLHVFVNYRPGYNGETSLSTIEAMRSGVVVIVRAIGWYSELPNDTVVKAKDTEEVIEKLQTLIGDKAKLAAIGKKARNHIAQNFGHRQYAAALQGLIGQQLVKDDFNHELAESIKAGHIKTKRQYIKFLKGSE